jgi:hypothetical protein
MLGGDMIFETKIDIEMKARIDAMTLVDLLRHWRFAPCGDPLFVGDIGGYFQDRINKERRKQGGAAWTAASKEVGH